MKFADRLNFALEKAKRSQSSLAAAIGLKGPAISMYLSGQREPDFETVVKIASFLEVDAGWLIGAGHEDEAFTLREQPAGDVPLWRRRASDAEKRLNDLRSGLRHLLEISSPSPVSSIESPEAVAAMEQAAEKLARGWKIPHPDKAATRDSSAPEPGHASPRAISPPPKSPDPKAK